MKKIINFIIWPTIAGLTFAMVLLQLPLLSTWFPSLSTYYPQPPAPEQMNLVSFSEAIKRAAPAVVSINSQQSVIRDEPTSVYIINRHIYRSFDDESNNSGSGVIISPDGYIITSYHIIYTPGTAQTGEISTITLNDGRIVEARPVILDQENDLALLKIDVDDSLPYVEVGIQSSLEVGDIVLAIGNPRNIGQSVTQGIISAIKRFDDSYVIQTDAAINPGNSGGALIDIYGNLIGINSTIISASGGSEGIGFAAPANKAISLLQTYLESDPGGYLGVESVELTKSLGIIYFGTAVEGLLVNRVAVNSPADKAGIRVGDIITGANDQSFSMIEENGLIEAMAFISGLGPGVTVNIDIFREQNNIQIPVVLVVGEPIIYDGMPVISQSRPSLSSPPENTIIN